MADTAWTFYRWWDDIDVLGGVFRTRDGAYERWNTKTKGWLSVPGDSFSRSIETGDPTIDEITESEALVDIGRLSGSGSPGSS